MAAPLTAGLPPDIDLGAGYVIRVTALDPTTGSPVAGVVLRNVSILVRSTGDGGDGDLAVGPWALVPGPSSA